MFYKFIAILILTLTVSCNSWSWWDKKGDDPITVDGPSDAEIAEGAKTQEKNTDVIDQKAKKIQKETKEPETKKDIKDVIDANDKLKKNKALLNEASLGKKQSDEALIQMKDKYFEEKKAKDKIQEKYDGKMSAFLIWFKIIGSIMIPLGIVGMIRISKEWGWLAVLGLCILISSMIVEKIEIFIDKYSNPIIAVIAVAIIFGVWRVIHQYREFGHSAVKANEIFKREVDKHKDGKSIREKVFGEYHHDGLLVNSDTTKKMINQSRKRFKKENDPL